MTPEEYKSKLAIVNEEHARALKALRRDYALSNNPYKVGSIVTDHIGSVMIERIDIHASSSELPQCIYHGLELKKDGTPKKNNLRRAVWQSNANRLKF